MSEDKEARIALCDFMAFGRKPLHLSSNLIP